MHQTTPLGAHPEIKDLTPKWVWRSFLTIYGIITIPTFFKKDWTTLDGIGHILFGVFLTVGYFYNRKNTPKFIQAIVFLFIIMMTSFGFYQIFLKP